MKMNTKYCPYCKETKLLTEFYFRRNRPGASAYCKLCSNLQTTIRHKKLKELAVTYKGGKCEICGYAKYLGALEFHHKDPTKKDFGIGTHKSTGINEKTKSELDKCSLVCSNCHKEIHGNIIKII